MFYEGWNRRLQSSDYQKKVNNWTFETSSSKENSIRNKPTDLPVGAGNLDYTNNFLIETTDLAVMFIYNSELCEHESDS
jgi:hypothetical protein